MADHPRDTCPSCLLDSKKKQDAYTVTIEDGRPKEDASGFIWRGSKYHCDDFVLYHDPEHANSPGQIGKIVHFQSSSRVSVDPWSVTIQVLERIGNLKHLPENKLRDEVRCVSTF